MNMVIVKKCKMINLIEIVLPLTETTNFYNFQIAYVKVIAEIKKRAHVKYDPICLIYWQASFLIHAKFGNNGIIKFAIIKIQNTTG